MKTLHDALAPLDLKFMLPDSPAIPVCREQYAKVVSAMYIANCCVFSEFAETSNEAAHEYLDHYNRVEEFILNAWCPYIEPQR